MKSKVYDCFMFFNELDLLELRLEEMYDYVDYFVLVEARQTHDRSPKPLHYELNKSRFKKYNKKIIHVVIDLPKFNLFDKLIIKLSRVGGFYKLTSKIVAFGHGRMKMDHFQRRQIMRGLSKVKDEDIIILSDLDEIPNVSILPKAFALAQKGNVVALRQKHFIYYMNGLVKNNTWIGTKICTFSYIKNHYRGDIQQVRVPLRDMIKQKLLRKKIEVVELPNGGWHFTYLGGWQRVILKKNVFAHSEVATKQEVDPKKVQEDIERGVFAYKKDFSYKITYIKLDKTFPKTVLKNKKRYEKFFKK